MTSGWELECTDEFVAWWHGLTASEQEAVAHDVAVLSEFGPWLGRPVVNAVKGSRFANLKELRTRVEQRQFRILFAFDQRRIGILLLGGDKTSDRRWYEKNIPRADELFSAHLRSLESMGDA